MKNVGIVSLLSVQRPKFFHMREDESGRIRNPLKSKPREPTWNAWQSLLLLSMKKEAVA